ncbi:MAG: helix-turn-helix domain-containing protein [Alphaproteobacteria bacterium]|nr:helix-turn-helix domain-containing protein [Alphaproteobacteria bacterium]MBV9694434.1 helix-turn-helix domain-containing protein [Alphaproteobacteria bacterium]
MTKVSHLTIEEGGGQNKRRIHLREISGDADAPLETVGQDLRAARLRRGDDLASVSKALKIRKDHLEALEEDRIEALPGRAYAVGFARTYAEYLGLDATACIERFKAQIAGRTDDSTPTITVIDEDEHRRLPQGWKIVAAVVLLLFAYGAYHLLMPAADKYMNTPAAPGTRASVDRPPPKTVVHEAPTLPASPATSPADGAGSAPAATGQPQSQGSQATLSAQAPAAAPVTLPQGKVYGQLNKNARVILRMKQTARILVQGADGTIYMNRALNAGDTYLVPDQVGLTLTTSNAGSIEIDLDGVAMGSAGRDGQVGESLSLDPQAIADRFNGRQG